MQEEKVVVPEEVVEETPEEPKPVPELEEASA